MRMFNFQSSIFNIPDRDTSKEGFVILIAVLVSSLMISLGAFIAGIAVKELSLSTSGRDSQLAFYAADAAVECALYHDLHVNQFATSSNDVSGSATVNCNSVDNTVTLSELSTETMGISEFSVSFPQNTGDNEDFSPFARVRITKNDIGGPADQTIIESRGYNVQSLTTTNRVERALEVTY